MKKCDACTTPRLCTIDNICYVEDTRMVKQKLAGLKHEFESTSEITRDRHGSPEFYAMLEKMADMHDKKSRDYTSEDDPFGNYHFAGRLGQLFNNAEDAGFVARIGEKMYRLANLENSNKEVQNEPIEDTEIDLCTIMTLWMASRRARRS